MCGGGELMGEVPLCTPLSQAFNYALDKPPTILFRHEQGNYTPELSLSKNNSNLLNQGYFDCTSLSYESSYNIV